MVNRSLKKLDRITKKGDTYSIETKHTNGIRVMEIISRKEAKESELKRYFTGRPCKHGHVSERLVNSCHCCACHSEETRKWREKNKENIAEKGRKYYKRNKDNISDRMRKWHERNKEAVAEQRRKYREQNKEKVSEQKCKYREQNKEMVTERSRKYYEQNKGKIVEYREQNKDKIADRMRKYHKANPEQKFIRNSLNRILNNWKGGRAKAEEILGYTCEQLRERIESQFKEGMSWDDRGEFHIDHIKPIKAFLDEGITDPAIINALDNLQPLWAHENLSKGAKHD